MKVIHLCITYRQLLMALCDTIKNENKATIVSLLDYQSIPERIQTELTKSYPNIIFYFVKESSILSDFVRLPHFYPEIVKRNISFSSMGRIISPHQWCPSFLMGSRFDVGYIYHSGPFMAKVFRGVCNKIILREDGLSNYVPQALSLPKSIIRFFFGLPWKNQVWGEEHWVNQIEAEYPERLPDIVKVKAVELKFSQLLSYIKDQHRQTLMKVFGLERYIDIKSSKSCLLLTQPIDSVGLCTTELKMKLYNYLIETFIKKGYKVYVKHHPKESVYVLDNTQALPTEFPIELWYYITRQRFNCCVALCSSAIATDAEPFAEHSMQLIPLDMFNSSHSEKWQQIVECADFES